MSKKDELKPYRFFNLTMLQIMGLLTIIGLVLAIIFH